MTQADFEYFKKYGIMMKSAHEKEFMSVINPDKILRAYEGVKSVDEKQMIEDENADLTEIYLNKFFPSTNTIISEFYPNNPHVIVSPIGGGIENLNAHVLESAINYYFKEKNAKGENQDAILNSWFFGFGVIKQGWHAQFYNKKESNEEYKVPFRNKVKSFFTGESMREERIEENTGDCEYSYEHNEGPFFLSISPSKIFLDHKKPFGKGKFITHAITKTLEEIQNSPLYHGYINEDFIKNFSGTKEPREIEVTLYEMWCQLKDGIHIFTYCDNWSKPLRWQKWGSLEEGFPFSFLRLNDEPMVTYPISHVKVAQRLQREIDYILSIWFENISKYRSMTYVNQKLFSDPKQAKLSIETNRIGGILYGDRPATGGDITPLTSTPMTQDAFGMLSILQSNMQEILAVTGAKQTGRSELETATQEKIAEMGNILRVSGMKEKIKDFVIDQIKRLAQQIQQFDTIPKILKITNLNMEDPETGEFIAEKWVKFGGGETELKDAIQGEYEYTIDFTETMSKDLPVIRKQMSELAAIAKAMEPDFNKAGKTFDGIEFFKDMARNFETISNPEKYLKDLKPQTPMPMQGEMGQTPVPMPLESEMEGIPSSESIAQTTQEIPL